MYHRVFEAGIDKINLSDLLFLEIFQDSLADLHRIRIQRGIDHLAVIFCDLIAFSFQCFMPFSADVIDQKLFSFQFALREHFHDVGVVTACQSSVG